MRFQRRFSARWLALAAGLTAACGPEALPPSDSAARIAGEVLPYRRFEQYLENNVGNGEPELSAAAMTQLFDQFLDEELIYRLARDQGWVSPEAPRRHAVEEILSNAPEAISDTQVEAYYEAHREQFQRPERVRLRQILVAERAQAEAALRALAAGEDFAEVASRDSLDPSASRGGEQGELSRADLPPAFAETIFQLAPGEVSAIVPAEYGYHIFKVEEVLPAETVAVEVAAPQIRDLLRQDRGDAHLGDLLAQARDRYNVEVYERNLPFEYRGFYRAPTNRTS